MLGIIIGVAAVITMIAVGAGAQARVRRADQGLGTNLIIIWPGSVTAGGVRMGAGSRSTLTEDDAYAIQREIAEVQAAAPTLRGTGQVVAGKHNWSTAFFGVTPEYFEARNWVIAHRASAFEAADMTGAAKVALLGETVARNLFGDSRPDRADDAHPQGAVQVIGVLERKGQSLHRAGPGRHRPDADLDRAQPRARRQCRQAAHRSATISVKVRDGADMSRGRGARSASLLRQRHRLQPGAGRRLHAAQPVGSAAARRKSRAAS